MLCRLTRHAQRVVGPILPPRAIAEGGDGGDQHTAAATPRFQKHLPLCCAIKHTHTHTHTHTPCGMCNRTRISQIAGIERVPFLRGWKLRFDQSEQGVKRWNETNQDGGPIDSNVISATLRQPHLLHESVVGSKLLSPRCPRACASFSLPSTHERSRARSKL